MSHEIRADYSKHYLLPPSLEDWIPEDHPARFIREYVDTLDIEGIGFKKRECRDGRPNYGADLLLKVWLYGYFSRIYTTRRLEQACYEHISLIWLTGMNAPDHNTLWRFFRDNKKAIRGVFGNCVRVAVGSNLIGLVLHAVDGTKIRAKVSKRSGWHRKDLEGLLKRIDESVDKAIEEIEATGEDEAEDDSRRYRLPKELQDREALRRKIKEALREMEVSGQEHLHPDDRETRMMKCEGKVEFGYNAQVVVDEKSGLIVGQEVVSNPSDAHLLTKMVSEVEKTLGEAAEESVADGGYASSEEIMLAQQKNYGVLVSMKEGGGDYHSSRFKYDARRDLCLCPRGMELRYERTKMGRHNRYQVRVYRCQTYRVCPYRWQCSQDKRGRQIEISEYHEAVVLQREKQKDPVKLEMMKKRKSIVECIFGHIKEAMGFRRFTVNGLEGVRTQWSLICTAMNLKRMYKWWLKGELALS